MTTLRQAAEQALEALDALAYWDGAIAKPAIDALRQALEADTKPCACCCDGNSRLSVTRICDTCGSEYAGQAEMDMAKRIEAEQQAEPVYWEHRVPVVGEFGQTVGYSKWKPGKGLSHWPHRALYEHPQPAHNLNCKSTQKRLATQWGFVPAQQPLTDEQILGMGWFHPAEHQTFLRFARAIERAHGITGETK